MLQGFTCECSQGKEEVGSSWPAEAELGCKVGDAAMEGTSHSRRCTEVEDLSLRKKIKKFSSEVKSIQFLLPRLYMALMVKLRPLVVKPANYSLE